MDLDINTIWLNILKVPKQQISDVSYKTWIEPLKLTSCNNDTLTFQVPSEFHARIVSSRYSNIIKDTIKCNYLKSTWIASGS